MAFYEKQDMLTKFNDELVEIQDIEGDVDTRLFLFEFIERETIIYRDCLEIVNNFDVTHWNEEHEVIGKINSISKLAQSALYDFFTTECSIL